MLDQSGSRYDVSAKELTGEQLFTNHEDFLHVFNVLSSANVGHILSSSS
jgi:hypothetical protein